MAKKNNSNNNQLWITDGINYNSKQIFHDSITGWDPIKGLELILFNDEIYCSANFVDSIGAELYKITIKNDSIEDLYLPQYLFKNFYLYPNPVSDVLTIIYQDNSEKLIQITDINGRILYNTRSCSSIDNIPVDMFNSGIYILNIRTADNFYSQKIIKQ